jgi:hypothetical protein
VQRRTQHATCLQVAPTSGLATARPPRPRRCPRSRPGPPTHLAAPRCPPNSSAAVAPGDSDRKPRHTQLSPFFATIPAENTHAYAKLDILAELELLDQLDNAPQTIAPSRRWKAMSKRLGWTTRRGTLETKPRKATR